MDCILCRGTSRGASRAALFLILAASILPAAGCGLLINVLYPGNMVDPLYDGLEERRVAIVCGGATGTFGPSVASQMLPKKVAALLRRNVRKIELIDQEEIEKWIDSNDWLDYQEIGRGVEADIVVAIDLASLSLTDGPTLYKGRADVKVTAYDMTKGGAVVFSSEPAPVIYPKTAGYHTTGMTEADFQRQFIAVLAREVAKNFYAYPLKEDFAVDKPAGF